MQIFNEAYILLPPLFCIAGYTEIKSHRIPNFATISVMVLALFSSFLCRGNEAFLSSLYGLLAGGGVLLPFCLAGVLGGGDFKLMAAVGAVVGWPFILPVMYFTALTGGIIAVIILLWKGRLLSESIRFFRRLIGIRDQEKRAFHRHLTLPYGLAIAGGTILALLREILL